MYLGDAIREHELRPERLPGEVEEPSFVQRVIGNRIGRGSDADAPARITGWRVWMVFPDRASGRWMLRSLARPYVWTAPGAHDPKPPRLDSSESMPSRLGFHLFKSRQDALRLAFSIMGPSGRPVVFGQAEAFGRVVEHQLGYRAQRVAIRQLTVCQASNGSLDVIAVADSLARGYECDVDILGRKGIDPSRPARPVNHPDTSWNFICSTDSDSVATEAAPDDECF